MTAPRFTPPDECPICGQTVPRNAKACPNCGADERSGWNEEESIYDGLDLPEVEEEPVARAIERQAPRLRRQRRWPTLVAIALLAVLLFGFLIPLINRFS